MPWPPTSFIADETEEDEIEKIYESEDEAMEENEVEEVYESEDEATVGTPQATRSENKRRRLVGKQAPP